MVAVLEPAPVRRRPPTSARPAPRGPDRARVGLVAVGQQEPPGRAQGGAPGRRRTSRSTSRPTTWSTMATRHAGPDARLGRSPRHARGGPPGRRDRRRTARRATRTRRSSTPTETDIDLVVINGDPACGHPALMKTLGVPAGGERIDVGGKPRVLNLAQAGADPDVAPALGRRGPGPPREGAPQPPQRRRGPRARAAARRGAAARGRGPRRQPHVTHATTCRSTGTASPDPTITRTATALAELRGAPHQPLPALTLDPLTAVDNPAFYDTIDRGDEPARRRPRRLPRPRPITDTRNEGARS